MGSNRRCNGRSILRAGARVLSMAKFQELTGFPRRGWAQSVPTLEIQEEVLEKVWIVELWQREEGEDVGEEAAWARVSLRGHRRHLQAPSSSCLQLKSASKPSSSSCVP
jgi:hypothetical protein